MQQTNEYRYMVTANGYESERVNRKAEALASAREIWRLKLPVSLYLRGEIDENGNEIRTELPLNEVEVYWIGNEDSHTVWFRSTDPNARRIG